MYEVNEIIAQSKTNVMCNIHSSETGSNIFIFYRCCQLVNEFIFYYKTQIETSAHTNVY